MHLVIVDSSKGDLFFNHLGLNCLNLNCLFNRSSNLYLVKRDLQPIKKLSSINLCNLASLCFKLKIDYTSDDCIELLKTIISVIRDLNKNIEFTQLEILNYDEEDLKSLSRLYLIDQEKQIVYVNKVLRESLKFLGFTDGQITLLPQQIKNLIKYIPEDILRYTVNQNDAYDKIKEVLIK